MLGVHTKLVVDKNNILGARGGGDCTGAHARGVSCDNALLVSDVDEVVEHDNSAKLGNVELDDV
eukprot:9468610-Ditylum_brightwellii.AAC.1